MAAWPKAYSQPEESVAFCPHGKQKRTKTRKEKAEEAKNLVVKTLTSSRDAAPAKAAVAARALTAHCIAGRSGR
jgi:hypothetical protein